MVIRFFLVFVAHTFKSGRSYSALLVNEDIVFNGTRIDKDTLLSYLSGITRSSPDESLIPWFTDITRAKVFGSLLVQEAKATNRFVHHDALRREVFNGVLYEFSQKGNRTKQV
ncbi:hypothetical protein KBA63_05525 [Candidatus Woesebacteria bacterium]|nr:hypothetical protein [Candidatus Woesebacteria bacterium]